MGNKNKEETVIQDMLNMLDDEDRRPSYEGLSVWQIETIRWDDDAHTTGKNWNTTIVCKDFEAVMKWLDIDRYDLRTEIRSINHLGHACAVIPHN